MRIFTSYLANAAKLRANGIEPVCISLYPPKWFSGHTMKVLAPTRKVFENSNQPDSVYIPLFYKEVLNRVDPKAIYKELERLYRGRDVALCCFERSRKECHRDIVAKWLEQTLGIEVKEYGEKPVEPQKTLVEPTLF